MKKMLQTIFTLLLITTALNAQVTTLIPADNSTDDRFGISVSITGDYLLMGATGNDDIGGAYIYQTTNGGVDWEEKQFLVAPDAASADNFGVAVSLSGNYAVIGADQNDDNGQASGSAYVFKLTASGWQIQAKLLPDSGTEYDFFGASVVLQGDIAIVGAWQPSYSKTIERAGNEPERLSPNAEAGSVYIFKRSGNNWLQQVKLQSPASTSTKSYGCSLALDNNIAVVGSYFEDNAKGAAYVYKTTDGGATWNAIQKLTAPDGAAGDNFGTTVSISGNYIFIGAPFDDINGDGDVGSAYVFTTTDGGNSWTTQTKLTASDKNEEDRFGTVSVAGDYALIGAYQNDDNGNDSGAAYIFQRSGNDWNQIKKIIPADGVAYDYFGYITALSPDYMLFGLPFNEDNGYESGKAYVANLADVVPV
ncbi:MAG: hypothetical protein GXO87_14380, partial [Chlorobi bacterium]|nr:hypothetical protein [Chlorobiota bacterium]